MEVQNWIALIIAAGIGVFLVLLIGMTPFLTLLVVPAYEWARQKFTIRVISENDAPLFVGGTTESPVFFRENSETLDNLEKGREFGEAHRCNRPETSDPSDFLR